VSRSFGRPVESLSELKEAVATYGARAATKVRREDLKACVMTVFITTNRFQPAAPQYANSAVVQLPQPTNDTLTLLDHGAGNPPAGTPDGLRVVVVFVGMDDQCGAILV